MSFTFKGGHFFTRRCRKLQLTLKPFLLRAESMANMGCSHMEQSRGQSRGKQRDCEIWKLLTQKQGHQSRSETYPSDATCCAVAGKEMSQAAGWTRLHQCSCWEPLASQVVSLHGKLIGRMHVAPLSAASWSTKAYNMGPVPAGRTGESMAGKCSPFYPHQSHIP